MEKSNLLLVAIVLFISGFLFFSGCGENSVQSVISRDLGGKVFGIFSVPQPNVIVKAKDKSTKTGQDGSFFLSQVTTPYSITVLDSVNKLAMEIISSQFQNFYPQNLAIQTYTSLPNYPTTININYPSGLFQSSGRLIFTDRNDINAYGFPALNGGSITINLGANQSVKGAVMVLFFTQFGNESITSYDKFACKEDITITSGGNLNLNFVESEFNSEIRDTTYNISYNPLPTHSVIKRYSFLSFSYRRTVDYLSAITFEEFNSNNFNLVIPVNLGKFFIPVVGFFTQDLASTARCRDMVPVNGNLTHNSVAEPVLNYPPDNSLIDTNAVLNFSANPPNSGGEFYIIYLYDILSNNRYTIITDENSYKISKLNTLGFGNISGKTFTWYIERFAGQLSFYINAFSSDLYLTRTSSENRKFSVKQ